MMEAIIYKGESLYLEESNRRLVIDKILLDIDFELIEDTIDSIEELDIDFLNGLDGFTLTEIERVCMKKQNEIIRKVNQLDKQIKELKK